MKNKTKGNVTATAIEDNGKPTANPAASSPTGPSVASQPFSDKGATGSISTNVVSQGANVSSVTKVATSELGKDAVSPSPGEAAFLRSIQALAQSVEANTKNVNWLLGQYPNQSYEDSIDIYASEGDDWGNWDDSGEAPPTKVCRSPNRNAVSVPTKRMRDMRDDSHSSKSEAVGDGNVDACSNDNDIFDIKRSFINDLKLASAKQQARGPAIDSSLASSLDILMRNKSEDADELRKVTNPPENCSGLCSVRVNSEVWSRISANAKHRDLRLQNVGNFIVAGTTHFAYLIDLLTGAWDQQSGVIPKDVVSGMLSHAQQAFKLMGAANYDLQMRRREFMKAEMNASHAHLCAPSVPFTTELFGDDVTKRITEITSQNRIADKALRTEFQRGRGRRRPSGRPTPYPRDRVYRYYRPPSTSGQQPFLGRQPQSSRKDENLDKKGFKKKGGQ